MILRERIVSTAKAATFGLVGTATLIFALGIESQAQSVTMDQFTSNSVEDAANQVFPLSSGDRWKMFYTGSPFQGSCALYGAVSGVQYGATSLTFYTNVSAFVPNSQGTYDCYFGVKTTTPRSNPNCYTCFSSSLFPASSGQVSYDIGWRIWPGGAFTPGTPPNQIPPAVPTPGY